MHTHMPPALYAVLQLDIKRTDSDKKVVLGVVVGVCNTILWSIMAIVPIIQVFEIARLPR